MRPLPLEIGRARPLCLRGPDASPPLTYAPPGCPGLAARAAAELLLLLPPAACRLAPSAVLIAAITRLQSPERLAQQQQAAAIAAARQQRQHRRQLLDARYRRARQTLPQQAVAWIDNARRSA